ncbi:hypothetical protein DIPPA_28595 [Diplonema papillatum]|nr:hypothetical protein DIPPA_28595 [Diplonema papillatum]
MAGNFRFPDPTLLVLFWFMADVTFGLLASLWVFKTERERLGTWEADLHLVLSIIGAALYTLILSGLIFWAYKYQYLMYFQERRLRVIGAVAICFVVRDTPCWILEFAFYRTQGWFHPVSTISFWLTTLTVLLGAVFIWLEYAWRMAIFIDARYGTLPVRHNGGRVAFSGGAGYDPKQQGGIAHLYHPLVG